MRVLVIGGNGFIGSHIIDALLADGVRVVVFDKNPERFRSPLQGVEYIFGTLNAVLSLECALSRGFDGVIHLASTTVPTTSNDHPLSDLENLSVILVLLELCVKFKVKKFIFASSGGTVYGIPETLPIAENDSTNPICSYGIGKLAAEKYLQLYSRKHALAHVILRIANPYGIRQSPEAYHGVIPAFVSRILHRKPITLRGDGSSVRDFICVRDVASLFLLALKSDAAGVFNVGTGIGTSINQLVDMISSHFEAKPVIVREDARDFDVPSIVLDCQKARSVYGWEPRVNLREGVAELADWLQSTTSIPVYR